MRLWAQGPSPAGRDARTILDMREETHEGGMFAAVGIAALASAGTTLTTFRNVHALDALWIALFVVAWLLLSAAAVNFDVKRWLW